ncbi:glycoside hydrolase family 5 protein [Mariniblastus fucicola]|uniref:Carbohydrate binding domain protein n=1 Tax=Mariniblastus fucicola TaxID=980251 RepID=A0A5B9PC46_9BACT|nr:carbohydrate binding domain-containing protein [Mariniblastus fucicola]QEG20681.1 Carbohydrate binding domain protein [Mariniblastus fucicola]
MRTHSVVLIFAVGTLLTVCLYANVAVAAPQPDLVAFHIPGDDASDTITSFASRVGPEAGAQGFVSVKNGKFSLAGKRQRFWGVNLCFSANFPTHEKATKIAAHFRKLGLNIVRFHHMDMQDAPGGIWRTKADGTRELDPEQIDRLDFFLNELHKNGIYANLNMHVSRTLTKGEGFPEYESGLWWTGSNKWVMYYDPDVQQELKKYCRDLLTHENPYRKLRRVDDPGLAMVEMLNENYFSVKGVELLRRLPKRFQDSFRVKWSAWLKQKYNDEASMFAAWESRQQPMGSVLAESNTWAKDLGPWSLAETNVSVKKTFGGESPDANIPSVRFVPSGRSDMAHHMQLRQTNLSVTEKQAYTLKLWVRADQPRDLKLELATSAGGEWRDLGLFETVQINENWQKIQRTILPRESIHAEVTLALNFGLDATPIEFAGVQLQEGAEMIELDNRQRFDDHSVAVPDTGWPSASHEDLQEFMVDTERAWIVELKDYLTDELGVKVPITASQENYHAPGVLAETCDFIDFHNYWHHPLFPGDAEWSQSRWTVDQQAIESAPTRSDWPANSLLMRCGWRYHDMPFTLSEWNQGEPNVTGSGAIMMAATIGAIQDWDGIMFFSYTENGDRFFADRFEGWFDFAGHPVKQAVIAAAGDIYLRGDLDPLKRRKSGTYANRVDGRTAFEFQIGVDVNAKKPDDVVVPEQNRFQTPDQKLLWDATDPQQAFMQLNTDRSKGVWGLIANQSFQVGDMTFDVGDVRHNYATILLTSKDDQPISQSHSMLLLASSSAENTGMKWNESRNSIGENWGTGPTLINPVNAEVRLPKSGLAGIPSVWSLDGTGQRTGQIETAVEGDQFVFEIGADHKTLWYEVEIK